MIPKNIKTIKREKIHEGRVFDVTRDYLFLAGKKIVFDLVEHKGAVCILPILNNGNIILVKQYRHAIKKNILELPAGSLNENEQPLNCAKRELEEETGFKAEKWKKLFEINLAPGYSSELLFSFIATNLKQTKQNLDCDEFLDIKSISFGDALKMIKENKICDAKTISTILYAYTYNNKFFV